LNFVFKVLVAPIAPAGIVIAPIKLVPDPVFVHGIPVALNIDCTNCPEEFVFTATDAGTAAPLTLPTAVALCGPVTSPASDPLKFVPYGPIVTPAIWQ
jgi:hypothetical protein